MRADGQHVVAAIEDALDLLVLEFELVAVALKLLIVGRADEHALGLEWEGIGRLDDAFDDCVSPVAKTRAALYDVEHPDTHSAQLKNGWFVATNNKAAEARGVLRQAVELAGLVWGVDFSIRRAG